MLTVEQTRNIIFIVASDPEASKSIESNIDAIVPAFLGIAGGIRNVGYLVLDAVDRVVLGDQHDPEYGKYANRACGGIADAASNALWRAIKNRDARVRDLKSAQSVHRILLANYHVAVRIDMQDGQSHVIDWHETLDADNPMLFESPAKWERGEGGIPFKSFRGWK